MAGVEAKQKKKFKGHDSKHTLPVTPNLLNREFKVKGRIKYMYLTLHISGRRRLVVSGCDY